MPLVYRSLIIDYNDHPFTIDTAMKTFATMTDEQQGYFYTIITMLIWGSFSLIARLNAYWQIQIWDVLAMRFGIAALILLPILWFRQDYRFLLDYRMILLALSGSIGYCVFVYSGFFYAPVVHGVVFLNGTFPLFAALIAYLMLGQKVDRQTGIGLSIIILTLTLMTVMMSMSDDGFGIGDAMFIGSALCWGLFSVLLRRWSFSPWQAMSGVGVWSAILYLPAYVLFVTPRFADAEPLHLAVQGLFHGIAVVIVATLTYAKAVAKIGLFKAGSIANLAPFVASILAVPLLGERLNPIMICGLLGMALGALQPWRWVVR